MIADGGEAISDIATLADQVRGVRAGGLGLDLLAGARLDHARVDLDAIAAARAAARAVAWAQRAEQTGAPLPASLVAGAPLLDAQGRPVLVIDDDAHHRGHAQREGTAPRRRSNTPSAITRCSRSATTPTRRWPGCCARATPARTPPPITSRCSMQALAQIPDEDRHGYPILVRADGAGASRRSSPTSARCGTAAWQAEFSIGWAVTDREHAAIAALPDRAWTPAIDIAGDPRESRPRSPSSTGVLPAAMLADYPPGTRIIVRRERPHPGAQLDLIETPRRLALHLLRHRHPTGQHAWLDARHRSPRPSRRPHPHAAKTPAWAGCRRRQFAINASVAGLRAHRDRPASPGPRPSCCTTTDRSRLPNRGAALPTLTHQHGSCAANSGSRSTAPGAGHSARPSLPPTASTARSRNLTSDSSRNDRHDNPEQSPGGPRPRMQPLSKIISQSKDHPIIPTSGSTPRVRERAAKQARRLNAEVSRWRSRRRAASPHLSLLTSLARARLGLWRRRAGTSLRAGWSREGGRTRALPRHLGTIGGWRRTALADDAGQSPCGGSVFWRLGLCRGQTVSRRVTARGPV